MSKRTALTETLVPVDPRHYVWWFPGSPLKVHLELQVVQKLKEHLHDHGLRPASEGLLFGGTTAGVTEILDFQPIAGRSIQQAIAALTEERKRSVIGYYRTEAGETLRLTGNDLALAQECFGKPNQVFLLISTAFEPPNATFFFHDASRRMADFAFLEFAFDPILLAMEEREKIQRSLDAAIEQPKPAPVLVPAPVPVTERRPGKKPFPFLKAAAGVGVLALLVCLGLLLARQESRERLAHIWGAVWNAIPGKGPLSGEEPASASRPSMALRARRQNGDLELNWNGASPVIAAATSGVISIQDGAVKRSIPLDATQVHGGSLLYSPMTEQIVMQLTVTTPSGPATESVMVVLPKVGGPTTYPWPESKAAVRPAAEPEEEPAGGPPARPSRPFNAPAAPKHDASLTPLAGEVPAASINMPSVASAPPAVLAQLLVPAPPVKAAENTGGVAPALVSPQQPPVPTYKPAPSVPAELRSLLMKPIIVEVKISINAKGEVVKAEAVPQKNVSGLIVSAAVNAARAWRFRPAQRGTDAFPSEMTISFVFRR